MNNIARVLVADACIPSTGYGSWSQRIEYHLQQYEHNSFDYLIAEYTDASFQSAVTKRYNCKQQKSKLLNKLFGGWRYRQYTKAVDEILSRHSYAIICVIDSLRLKKAIWNHIKKRNFQARIKLVYYQCGFSKYLSTADYERFAEGVNECIYLTHNAYRFDLLHNASMPFLVNILHNPVNHHVYHPVPVAEKTLLKKELGMQEDVIHFIWASHDRPKKGLDVVLAAWLSFYRPDKRIALQVLGGDREVNYAGVTFHGKIPNSEMDSWFKAADIGIFSSVWPEGFGLSLAEQISCELFSIASTAGGVQEYFVPGKHGIAIADPNIVEQWVKAFESSLVQLPSFVAEKANQKNESPAFLSYNQWCNNFQEIFDGVENRFLK